MGGGGPEDVAPGERRSGRLELELGVVEHDRTPRPAGHGHRRRQQPVVGSQQHALAVADLDRHRPAVGADARVDDGQHDTAGHVLDGPGQGQRGAPHVVGGDVVGEIDHRHVTGDVTDHRLHDADELVTDTEVGQEGDGVVAGGDHGVDGIGSGPGDEQGWCRPPDGTSPAGAALTGASAASSV